MKDRWIEKETGKLWRCNGFSTSTTDHIRRYMMIEYDSKETGWDKYTYVTAEEREERFEHSPWPKPIIDPEPVKPKHPLHIVLRCPECGSILRQEGGVKLTSPAQYEHVCSNPDCKYETCTHSYYSGMYVAVTDEQKEKIMDGTFEENRDGELIKLNEKDLWDFKSQSDDSGINLIDVINSEVKKKSTLPADEYAGSVDAPTSLGLTPEEYNKIVNECIFGSDGEPTLKKKLIKLLTEWFYGVRTWPSTRPGETIDEFSKRQAEKAAEEVLNLWKIK